MAIFRAWRLLVTDAIVLHAFDYLESSRILRLVTREPACAACSRRARVDPRAASAARSICSRRGRAQLYAKPGRDLDTLSAFDVTLSAAELADDLGRFTGASAIAELTLRFGRDAADPRCSTRVVDALDAIARAPPRSRARRTLAGAWRIVAELGLRPRRSTSAPNVTRRSPPTSTALFSHPAGGALCARCGRLARGGPRCFRRGARRRCAIGSLGAHASARPTPSRSRAPAPAARVSHASISTDGRPLRAFERLGARQLVEPDERGDDPRHGGAHRSRQDDARARAHRRRHRSAAGREAARHHDRARLRAARARRLGTIGVVDVPGHEAFVRTMVAGATGIDLALLVVAADEGVMPQTREHLAILDCSACGRASSRSPRPISSTTIGSRSSRGRAIGVARRRARRRADRRRLRRDGRRVRRAARRVCAAAARPSRRARRGSVPHADGSRVHDRGTGTVVTGTVWSGRSTRREVRALPVATAPCACAAFRRTARGRSTAAPAAGRDRARRRRRRRRRTRRGRSSGRDAWRPPSSPRRRALLPTPLAPVGRALVCDLHVGTSEVGARIVATAATGRPGEPFGRRSCSTSRSSLRAGDRFVLRASAPLNTIAGGVVDRPAAHRGAGVRSGPLG